jgi:biotin-dependent carboxylase-like uncharacterized protein
VTHGPERAHGLEVLRAGPLTTVQDRGRIGLAHLGVGRSGAADRGALGLANRLVGNAGDAAGLEVLLGGLEVRAVGHLVAAVCGADCPVTLDGRPVPADAVLDLPPGSRLALGTAWGGLRAYLAVRGGLAVEPVLGSRSHDTLAGLGPGPLRDGDLLPVGAQQEGWPVLDRAPVADLPGPDDVAVLRAVPGPRLDWLDPGSAERLWRQTWHVSPDSDRVGVRLRGPALARTAARERAELPSEPLVRGAAQLPPGGHPVLFLADHPVTGGYPVVAVVLDADTDLLGQLRPGQPVRLCAARPADLRRPAVRPDLRCPWWGW